jgi:hypothetical protein
MESVATHTITINALCVAVPRTREVRPGNTIEFKAANVHEQVELAFIGGWNPFEEEPPHTIMRGETLPRTVADLGKPGQVKEFDYEPTSAVCENDGVPRTPAKIIVRDL